MASLVNASLPGTGSSPEDSVTDLAISPRKKVQQREDIETASEMRRRSMLISQNRKVISQETKAKRGSVMRIATYDETKQAKRSIFKTGSKGPLTPTSKTNRTPARPALATPKSMPARKMHTPTTPLGDHDLSSIGSASRKSSTKKKKKKTLYSWENTNPMGEETEHEKMLRLSSRTSIHTLNVAEPYHPSSESEGWYIRSEAEPCPSHVDFRVVMSEQDFAEFQARRRRHFDNIKHKKRFGTPNKENELGHHRTPYVDKGLVEKGLYRGNAHTQGFHV